MSWNYKLISRLPQDFTEEDILFLKQLGIEYTYYSLPIADHNRKAITELVRKIENGGLRIELIQSNRFTFNPYITLGIEDRNAELEAYAEYIEICAELGIHTFEQNPQPYFVYSSGIETTTRGAKTRTVDVDVIVNSKTPPFAKPAWINPDQIAREKMLAEYFYASRERGYTKEELWDNFAYFMEKIMPVCEKVGSRISLHPSDPPCEEPIGGVPQLIASFEDYKKAIRIADSKALGVTFCCGCWLEAGDRFGNILENMEELLKDDRITTVHLRNITDCMPRFDETFIDNGFFDYYPVFRLLAKYGYKGYINPDHHPIMVDGAKRWAPQSYAIGFLRAYCMRASEDEGK